MATSIVEVCVNPTDPWAWAGFVGDSLDLVPFVTGAGELNRVIKGTLKIVDNSSEVVSAARKLYNRQMQHPISEELLVHMKLRLKVARNISEKVDLIEPLIQQSKRLAIIQMKLHR